MLTHQYNFTETLDGIFEYCESNLGEDFFETENRLFSQEFVCCFDQYNIKLSAMNNEFIKTATTFFDSKVKDKGHAQKLQEIVDELKADHKQTSRLILCSTPRKKQNPPLYSILKSFLNDIFVLDNESESIGLTQTKSIISSPEDIFLIDSNEKRYTVKSCQIVDYEKEEQQHDITELARSLTTKETELESLQEEINTLHIECERITESLQAQETTNSSLCDEIRELEDRIQLSLREISDITDRNEDLQEELIESQRRFEIERNDLIVELNDTRIHLGALEVELDTMQGNIQ